MNTRIGRDSERGAGLILVVIIGAMLMGMSVLALSLFQSSNTRSSRHVAYEQAVHVAEQGLDETIARLQYNPNYNTATAPSSGPFATAAAEKAWVDSMTDSAPEYNPSVTPTSPVLKHGPKGDYVAVKPSGKKVIYTKSWIPNRASARRTRVLKAEYLLGSFNPSNAILVGGNLTVSGSVDIGGIGGNVHANGAIDASVGGGGSISGTLTSSGAATGDINGTVAVGGQSKQDIPKVDPLTLWTLYNTKEGPTPIPISTPYPNWYDLCPDGSVRVPDNVAGPCTGTLLDDADLYPLGFLGWKRAGTTWSYNSGNNAGTFYVHQGSINVSGNPAGPWVATLIASAIETSSSPCARTDGDISISGTPDMRGHLNGGEFALVAGRDLDIAGNVDQTFGGLMSAWEQIKITGNPTLQGAVLGQDRCASGSITGNQVSGSVNLTYNKDIELLIGNIVRTTLWLEL